MFGQLDHVSRGRKGLGKVYVCSSPQNDEWSECNVPSSEVFRGPPTLNGGEATREGFWLFSHWNMSTLECSLLILSQSELSELPLRIWDGQFSRCFCWKETFSPFWFVFCICYLLSLLCLGHLAPSWWACSPLSFLDKTDHGARNEESKAADSRSFVMMQFTHHKIFTTFQWFGDGPKKIVRRFCCPIKFLSFSMMTAPCVRLWRTSYACQCIKAAHIHFLLHYWTWIIFGSEQYPQTWAECFHSQWNVTAQDHYVHSHQTPLISGRVWLTYWGHVILKNWSPLQSLQ